MYAQKMRLCVFLIVLVIILHTCEARFRGGRGSRGRSWSRSRRTVDSFSGRSRIQHDTYRSRTVDHDTYRSRTVGHDTYRSRTVGHGSATSAPRRSRLFTARPKVTLPTAGPDIGFRKVNSGRNYYQTPPTLKPLYPKQSYSFSGQPSPVIMNQPIYVNPHTYHNNHDNTLLGTYLGYQMGRHMHGHSHNHYDSHYYSDSNDNNQPRYAVVHHYHHYDRPVPKEIQVEKHTLGQCGHLGGFCTPNTTALCLTNGTVYCLASQESTTPCTINSTSTFCVNAKVTIPCVNNSNCASEATTLSMPCVSYISLNTSIHNVSINNLEKKVITIESLYDSFLPWMDEDTKNVWATLRHSDQDEKFNENVQKPSSNDLGSPVTRTSEVKTFCVTLIAEPLLVSKNMTNEQFLSHVQQSEDTRNFVNAKHVNLMQYFLKSLITTNSSVPL